MFREKRAAFQAESAIVADPAAGSSRSRRLRITFPTGTSRGLYHAGPARQRTGAVVYWVLALSLRRASNEEYDPLLQEWLSLARLFLMGQCLIIL
jgi:hypothetical protein